MSLASSGLLVKYAPTLSMYNQKVRLSRYVDRYSEIVERCRGRRVLHLGCVGFTDCPVEEKVARAKESLHQLLTDISDCVGVDLDQESVEQLQERGIFQNVRIGDVERLDALPVDIGLFDIVVAGDIIEHLSNPGKMLDGIKRFLKPQGQLIVSTPNSMGLPAYARYVLGRFHEGLQHVLCFNPINLSQLLQRHGYRVAEALSCHERHAQTAHGLLFGVGKAFLNRFPKYGGTLLFIAQPEAASQ